MENFTLKWELLKIISLLKNKWIEVEHRIYTNHFSKGEENYYIVTFSPKGTVITVALTPENEVILLKQYRPAADKQIFNLPGGRIKDDDTSEMTARKELGEETGYSAEKLRQIHETFQNPARVTDRTKIFLAQNVQKAGEPKLDSAEKGLSVLTVKFENIIKLLLGEVEKAEYKYLWPKELAGKTEYLKRNDVCDLTTIAALLLTNNYQKNSNKELKK